MTEEYIITLEGGGKLRITVGRDPHKKGKTLLQLYGTGGELETFEGVTINGHVNFEITPHCANMLSIRCGVTPGMNANTSQEIKATDPARYERLCDRLAELRKKVEGEG